MFCLGKQNKWKPQAIYLIIVLIFFSVPLSGRDFITINDSQTSYQLGGYLYLLEDQEGTLDVPDVLESEAEFQVAYADSPNIGFTSSVYWLALSVQLDSDYPFWLLDHNYPPMDNILFYALVDGQIVDTQVAGDAVPLQKRGIKGRTSRFRLMAKKGQTVTYLLRFETQSSMVLSLKIWRQDAFDRKESLNQFILGMYFGLMLVMVLYNLFYYASARDRAYLFYVLFVATHALFQSGMLGVASIYLWPNSPGWNSRSMLLFAALALLFSVVFSREFLQMKKRGRFISIGINVLLVLSIINSIFAAFLPYSISIVMTNTGLIVFSGVIFFMAAEILRRGYKPARYYLIAWSALLFAVFIVALKNFGLVPDTPFTSRVLQIGSTVEIILLSLALSDRINILRHEHIKTEQQLRIAQEKELQTTEEMLYKDRLTTLPNRNRLLLDSERIKNPTLFLINIDQFRQINNFYGNSIGDQVILELKQRIIEAPTNQPTSLYKLHADEFALIIDDDLPADRCIQLGNLLHAQCEGEPFNVDDQQIRLRVSIGISYRTRALLEQADMALSEARLSNTNVRVYDPSMQTRKQYENNLRWVSILRDAIRADAIVPYFQPILNNRTGKIDKHECLIRLNGQDGKVISPGEFLAIAKASRLYPELSRRMIQKCFAVFQKQDGAFTLNISIDDILQEETLEIIRTCLENHPNNKMVVLEILESEGIHQYDIASKFINEMKERGCSIAIDDFGSGYSNFEHILKLKVDFLKIDSSLIRNIDQDRQARAIVETIQEFATRLEIQTVAEYVHSHEVQRVITELGVHFSQGYFIGAPEPMVSSNI